MKIYVFGNILLKEDSLPLKLLPDLQREFPKIEFIICDPNENFPPNGEKNLIILDTVKGIKEPMILDFSNLENIKSTPISPHDYDLMFHLQFLVKLKKINSVIIIGVPSVISTSLLKNEQRRTYMDQMRGLISPLQQ